jgi:hypothetical protein
MHTQRASVHDLYREVATIVDTGNKGKGLLADVLRKYNAPERPEDIAAVSTRIRAIVDGKFEVHDVLLAWVSS